MMNAKLTSLGIVVILLACACAGIAAISRTDVVSGATGDSAQAAPQFAPVNPAFTAYEQHLSAGKARSGTLAR
jgi:hypothetical protein